MTIRGIYNADGTTTYTVADQRNIHNKSFNGKIIYGNTALVVSAQSTPNMTIKVSSGECSINGAILQNTTSTNLTITSNTASYARIDAIVAYINGTTYDLRVLKGTAAATPSAPDCSSNMYVKLAEIYVGVGVSSIQTSNITDCRNISGQHVINSLTDLMFAIEETTENLKKRVLDNKRINILSSYSYTIDSLVAKPGEFYVAYGTTKATVKGMNADSMKDGDSVYFCLASAQPEASLILLEGNNFLLPPGVTQLKLTGDVVYECIYFDGKFHLAAY